MLRLAGLFLLSPWASSAMPLASSPTSRDPVKRTGVVWRLKKSGTGMVPGENCPILLEMKYPANYLC